VREVVAEPCRKGSKGGRGASLEYFGGRAVVVLRDLSERGGEFLLEGG